MAANEIHLYDIGTVFELTMKDSDTVVDLSTAQTLEIIFQKPAKPSPIIVTKTASLKTDGTDGIMQYTTIANDLDTLGTWKIQGRVTFDATRVWSSDTAKFKVYPNLD